MPSKYAIGVALLVCPAFAIGASAQSQSVDSLSVLLTEVHALRITLDQQATIGPRVQLTISRLNIEEQRVAHLDAELNDVRLQLNRSTTQLVESRDQAAEYERLVTIEVDPAKRRQYDIGRRDASRRLQQLEPEQLRLRTQESDTLQAIATERARWFDLNNELDEFDRLLSAPR